MSDGEQQYLNVLREVLEKGHYRKTRNANTLSLFGKHLEFSLKDNTLPVLTTKRMFLRGIFEELKFFLGGHTNSKILENNNVSIWKPNTTREFLDGRGLNHYEEGDMGPMYFFQVFHFNAPYEGCRADYTNKGFNQFEELIHLLKTDRFSRRMILTTYNPLQAKEGVLYPCHGITIQFGIENDNELCCHMHQRSTDLFLGESWNLTSYSLLVHILCNYVNHSNNYTGPWLIPSKLTLSLGDCHIYETHVDAVKTQLERTPFPFPKLNIKTKITDFNELRFEDFELIDYKYHPPIKADMVA